MHLFATDYMFFLRWFVGLLLGSWAIYYFLEYRKKPRRCKGDGDPRTMSAEMFEAYTAHWLSKNWRRNVKTTKHVKDNGRDVIAYKKWKLRYFECKRYTNSTVGVSIVREIYGVSVADGARAWLAYVWKLSKEARKFAVKHGVVLLDFN